MGIVHHSVYPVWYEVARMDFFEKLGFSFLDMQSIGVNPAMVDLHIVYKAPAGYPQTLTIKTSIAQFAPRKLGLHYELSAAAGNILNTADTFHVWTGPDGKAYNVEENLPEVYAKLKLITELAKGEQSGREKGWLTQEEIDIELGI
jgi:acyl-CoA thioester hydrolase